MEEGGEKWFLKVVGNADVRHKELLSEGIESGQISSKEADFFKILNLIV